MTRADLIEMRRRRIASLNYAINRQSERLAELLADKEREERELSKLTNGGESEN